MGAIIWITICILFYGRNYMEIYMFLFHMIPNAFFHLMKSICFLFHAENQRILPSRDARLQEVYNSRKSRKFESYKKNISYNSIE